MRIRSKRLCCIITALMMIALLAPNAAFASVTSVKLDKEFVHMEKGEAIKLTAAVTGGSQNVDWKSSDPAVAEVADGTVTAKSQGTAIITAASSEDSKRSASCSIYVYKDALQICSGSAANVIKTFDKKALETAAWQKNISVYSGFNSYNTYEARTDVKGPDLAELLNAAGYPVSGMASNALIGFAASDGLQTSITAGDLFADRYYYPNAASCTGGVITGSSLAGRVRVPAVLDLGEQNKYRICFGQVAPNEHNLTYSVKFMLGGKIIVNAGTAGSIAADVRADIPSGSSVTPGQEIKLSRSRMTEDVIHYTTDGTTPSRASNIYNYNNYDNASLRLYPIKAPAKEGKFTVKTRVMQYNKQPGAVQTFTYTVKKLPVKGKNYKVGKNNYKITKAARTGGTVAYAGPAKKSYKSVSVPKTVKIKGYTFAVTSVGAKAFYNNTKLKKVTIGANVTTIGAKAFYKDKKLKTISINGKKLKKVGSSALRGIYAKAKIRVPKSKLRAYKKVFKNKGQKKSVKIVKK